MSRLPERRYQRWWYVGDWYIRLEPPYQVNAYAMNRIVDHATRAFLGSFSGLYEPNRSRGVLVTLDERGAPIHRGEWEPFAPLEGWRFRPASGGELSERVFIAALEVRCDVVAMPASDQEEPFLVPSGGYFNYGIERGDDGLPVFSGPVVNIGTAVELWLDVAHDLAANGQEADEPGYDNRAIGRRNRPRLEQALRQWEASMAKPITQVKSNWAPDEIGRYGFYGEDEIPPAPMAGHR